MWTNTRNRRLARGLSDLPPLAVNNAANFRIDLNSVMNAWQPDEYANQYLAEVARQRCFAPLAAPVPVTGAIRGGWVACQRIQESLVNNAFDDRR